MEAQSQIQSQIINNKEYILGDCIFSNAPIYTKGCRSSRDIISKKQIEAKNYIYARYKDDKWVITDGKSFKFDKILFIKSFVDKIPELKSDTTYVVDDNGVTKAPAIIELKNEEKFTDNDGNIIEIETRGERAVDKIYFKVKDVADGFEMPNLEKNIKDTKSAFIINKHYVIFNCPNNKIKKYKKKYEAYKPETFLTLAGLRRVFEVSQRKFSHKTKCILHKWLSQNFNNTKLNEFKIDIIKDNLIAKVGYVYCVSSPVNNYVKLGFWRGSISSLHSRYITYYGNKIDIFYLKTMDARDLETKLFLHFSKYNISNELFDINYKDDYIQFIKDNVEECDDIVEDYYELNENYPEYNYYNKPNNASVSCIYLFSLGTVASLRKTFNIPTDSNYNDNDIVIKYGRTDDLERRTTEHNNDYGKLENVELRLLMYSFVDASYAVDAENDIANFYTYSKYKFETEGRNEMAIIPKDKIDMVKKEYEKIRKIYAGSLKELLNEIERLKQENENIKLHHQIELNKQTLEMNKQQMEINKLEHSLELQKEKYEHEILKRDFELYKLKN